MPIRIKLTLWYSLFLGAILIIFSTMLYMVLEYSLNEQVDSHLEDRAGQLTPIIRAGTHVSPGGGLLFPKLDIFASPAVFIQIIRLNGQLVQSTHDFNDFSFARDLEILKVNRAGAPIIKTVMMGAEPLRIYSAPILVNGDPVGAVQVGQSVQMVEDTLRAVFFWLTGGTALALVLTTGVSAMLAKQATNPIERISQAASHIVSAQDLKQRLPMPKTNDEIAALTMTINDMLERLDKFFQAQIRLSADVSHELRTPLTAIRGNVDLLRRGAASDPVELHEALSIIDAQLDRMSRIVADLLLLSQADAGMSLRLDKVELDTIVLDVYRQARVIANGVNIQLGHEDQAVVNGDADRLQQLLINLVTNAIKNTPPGGRVTLSLFREREWVRVVVEDTGRGIAPDSLPHIFERFYQASPHSGQKGSGLGLSIAQWIANAHHGHITVESELHKGSVFTLWLPARTLG
jgi:signal transduction histidine kinase